MDYQRCKDQELGLGLDLQGGMSVTLEVSIEDLVRNFAGNSSSGSQLDASKLSSDYCETKASSGSDLSVNCDEEFIANASSGAHIENHEFSIKTTVKSSSGGHVDTKN